MILDEIKGFYKIIALKEFRKTKNVRFDSIDTQDMPNIAGVDRVLHSSNAQSPGAVGDCLKPWYMHPFQEDNLMVFQGTRFVEIYNLEHKRIEKFEVSPNMVRHGDKVYDCPAMVVWPCNVFHRIVSGSDGSASVNFAVRFDGFDIDTNFNIYDLDTATGEFKVVRKGALDQN